MEALGDKLSELAKDSGYDTIEEMLADNAVLLDEKTVFNVEVAAPLQKSLGGRTRLVLTVRGRPSVFNILGTLHEHPLLRGHSWALQIEPDLDSNTDTVLPNSTLTLILPSDDPSTPPHWIWGPSNRAVWSLPVLTLALFQGFPSAAHLLALGAALALTAVGVFTDPEFFGSKKPLRQSAVPRRSA